MSGLGTWFGVTSQYLVLVRHSGNPEVWTSNPWQFLVTLGSTGLSLSFHLLDIWKPDARAAALLVQLFFVYRIARFGRDIVGKTMATLITLVCSCWSPRVTASDDGQVAILAFAGFLAIMVLVSPRIQGGCGLLSTLSQYVRCGLNTLELETVLPKAITRVRLLPLSSPSVIDNPRSFGECRAPYVTS